MTSLGPIPIAGPFRNLIGLETEYAIRFRPKPGHPAGDDSAARPSDKQLFERLVASLKRFVPVADAHALEPTSFLATGGAVKFERFWQSVEHGLVEGATPECLSPRDLVIWQRAQDKLFSKAADVAGETDGKFVLIKNNRDSFGNSYGSHENYDTIFATGIRLWLWRIVVAAIIPIVLLGWVLLVGFVIGAVLLIFLTGGIWYALAYNFSNPGNRPKKPAYLSLDEEQTPFPRWFEPIFHFVLGLAFAPAFAVLETTLRLVAFHPSRKQLTPFLISRIVVSGSGWVDTGGNFFVSQKVTVCNRVMGLALWWAKPIYNFGNLAESNLFAFASPRTIKSLWRGRQRMHISYGDSNLCEVAEYVRLATTRLVLDAIEAGYCRRPPKVRRCVKTLHRLNAGNLDQTIATHSGQALTAIDVQRWYIEQVRSYLSDTQAGTAETDDVCSRWEFILGRLQQQPDALVGHLDWITKRFVLRRAGDDLSLSAKRVIDLKYHELSPDGYFFQLAETGVIETIVSQDELERAMRTPPATRAAARGRYIREFANTNIPLKIDWESVKVGKAKRRELQ